MATDTRAVLVIKCPKCQEEIRISFTRRDLKQALKKLRKT